MGTRCDFYIGTGKDAEWLGSLAYDGYRIDEMTAIDAAQSDDYRACWEIKNADSPQAFRAAVARLLSLNDDATTPDQGWPWPWDDSNTTDYAYAFAGGACRTFNTAGHDWPDMSARKNVTYGKRSGMITLVFPKQTEDD